jgi:hypothetical protein
VRPVRMDDVAKATIVVATTDLPSSIDPAMMPTMTWKKGCARLSGEEEREEGRTYDDFDHHASIASFEDAPSTRIDELRYEARDEEHGHSDATKVGKHGHVRWEHDCTHIVRSSSSRSSLDPLIP